MVWKIIGVAAFLGFAVWGMHVTDAQAEACQKSTGWSIERCRMELTR